MKRRIFSVGVVLLILMVGLFSGSGERAEAAGVKLNKKSLKLNIGKKYTLKVKGTKAKVIWTSSKPKVVSVSKKGVIKAIKEGTAKITAKVKKKQLVCTVKAVDPEAELFRQLKKLIMKNGIQTDVDGRSAHVVSQDVTSEKYGTLMLIRYFYCSAMYFSSDDGEESVVLRYASDLTSSEFNKSKDSITMVEAILTPNGKKKCTVKSQKTTVDSGIVKTTNGEIIGQLRSGIKNNNELDWSFDGLDSSAPDYENEYSWLKSEFNGYLDAWYSHVDSFITNSLGIYLQRLGFGI